MSSSRCPSCSAPLAPGVLRCKTCGADARAAESKPGEAEGFSVESIAPEVHRVAALVHEFEQLAPEVWRWWRTAPREAKTRLYEILTEMREVIRGRKGDR